MRSVQVHVTGVVQGVGFRPYVWNLADRLHLLGWVRNTASGVDIGLEGDDAVVERFLRGMGDRVPPLARIDAVTVTEVPPRGYSLFTILESTQEPGAYLPVSPDVAVCEDCLRELFDPRDRRYRYPFINCTNCGPRYTIIRDVPYDRPRTTMDRFAMCRVCSVEYHDPVNRRFHAQPVACPACGPRVWLEAGGTAVARGDAALERARERLAAGEVVAVKGLGGFHLACDATNPRAVARLRGRKHREEKPFALMAADAEIVARYAVLSGPARNLLESAARPVVLLPPRTPSRIAPEAAPGLRRLGFMLPYTPLHHLLLETAPGFSGVLVMTSGNLCDEPIAFDNADARRRLGGVADAFLMHDRDIHVRCDDSVAAEHRGRPVFHRRSRGFVPLPVPLPVSASGILAVGGELKNVVCLTRDDRAFLSHHIGDLDTLETVKAFAQAIEHLQTLFRVRPRVLAHDLHPDYRSTRYARERAEREGLPVTGVQHHHAHIAAGMAENGVPAGERVIGVALDGTGYGTDGTIWGGEFLVAGYADFQRVLHLAPCPMPGGDAAVRNPCRMALAWMRKAGIAADPPLPAAAAMTVEERDLVERMLDAGINVPLTSSMGRLFDAAAALAGIRQRVSYEAQAACELEAAVDPGERGAYAFALGDDVLDPAPALHDLAADVRAGRPAGIVAARFHRGVADAVAAGCRRIRHGSGLDRVVLSGGVWQNLVLLREAVARLEAAGFRVLTHRRVPAGDGGLALGQAAVAAVRRQRPGSRVEADASGNGGG